MFGGLSPIFGPLAFAWGAFLVSCRLAAAQDTQCELLPSASGDESSGFAIVKLAPLPQDESVSFSAYLLPKNEQPADRFRIQSLFPWFSGDVCLLHLRGWPQGVSGAVDLLLEVSRGGKATRFRIEKATTITERRATVALLVDDSYSMRRHDPDKLRVTATKTFGEIAAGREDVSSLSLISFARNATVLMSPTPPKQKETLDKALGGLKAEGRTDMDLAFSLAAKILEVRNENRKIAVVLSDGRNEPGDYKGTHRVFASRAWPVYTIGLSNEADVETLKKIAAETGGKFFFAPTADELAGIFREIAFSIHKTVRVADWEGEPGEARTIPVDDSIGLLALSLTSGTAVSIRSPDGKTLDPIGSAAKSSAEVRSPAPGEWTVANTGADKANVSVTGSSDLELDPYPVTGDVGGDSPVQAACLLVRGGEPEAGARVTATCAGERPRVDVQFFDDGKHGDGRAGDGIYGGVLGPRLSVGACRFIITATGRTGAGFAFERSAGLEFTVTEPPPVAVPVVEEPPKQPPPAQEEPEVAQEPPAPAPEPEPPPVVAPVVEEPPKQPPPAQEEPEVAQEETVPAPEPEPSPVAAPVVEEPPKQPPPAPEKTEVAQEPAAPPSGPNWAGFFAIVALLALALTFLAWLILSRKTRLSPFARCALASTAGHALALLIALNLPAQDRPVSKEDTSIALDIEVAASEALSETADMTPSERGGASVKETETAASVDRRLAESSAEAERTLQRPEAEAERAALEPKRIEQETEMARREADLPKKTAEQAQMQEKLALEEKLAEKKQEVETERHLELPSPSASETRPERITAEPEPPEPRAEERAAAAPVPSADAPVRLSQDMTLAKAMNVPAAEIEEQLAVNAHSAKTETQADVPAAGAGLERRETGSAESPRGAAGPEEGTARAPDLRGVQNEQGSGIAAIAAGMTKRTSGDVEVPVEKLEIGAAKNVARAKEDTASSEKGGVFAGRAEAKSSDLRLLSAIMFTEATNLSPSSASTRTPAPGLALDAGGLTALAPSGISKSATAQAAPVPVDEAMAGPRQKSAPSKSRETGQGFLSVARAETAGKAQTSGGAIQQPLAASPGAVSHAPSPVGLVASAGEINITAPAILAERAGVAPQTPAESSKEELSAAKVIKKQQAGRGDGKESPLSVGKADAAGGRQMAAATAGDVPLPAVSARASSQPLAPLTTAEMPGAGGAAQGMGAVSEKRTTVAQLADVPAGEDLSARTKKAGKTGTTDGARDVNVSSAKLSEPEHRAGAGSLSAAPRPISLEAASADVKAPVRPDAVVPRLSFSMKAGAKGGKTAQATISLARHSGDWNCSPTAMMFLAHQLEERTGMAIETSDKVLDLSSPDLMKLPFVYMTGHKDFVFSDAEVQNLRKYLEAGGHLWGDDSTDFGDGRFDAAFRREIARVLPDGKLTRLPAAFAGFKTGYDLTRGYKGYAIPPGDKYRLDYLEGIVMGDRVPVVYSRNDYGDGLNINPNTHALMPSLTDLSPGEMQEGAVRMGVNLVLYFLTAGGKSEEAEFLGNTSTTLRENAAAAKPALPQGETRVLDPLERAEGWTAESWGDAAELSADNKKLQVRFSVGGQKKAAFTQQPSAPLEISASDTLAIDAESRLNAGCRLALGLVVGNKYYETQPFYIKPGSNTAFFKMAAPTFKTEETKWEYRAALGLPVTVDKATVLIYSPAPGEIAFHNFRVVREKGPR